jgi:hypothetical protein
MSQTFEGTWEEITRHAAEWAGKRMRVTILSPEPEQEDPVPNRGMLAALDEIAKRQEKQRETSGEGTQELIRQARAGAMYGSDPVE